MARLKVLFLPLWYPQPGPQRQVNGIFVREHARAAAAHDDVAVLYRRLVSVAGEPDFMAYEEFGLPTFAYAYHDWPLPGTSWLKGWPVVRAAYGRVVERWGRPDVIHAQEPMTAWWASRLGPPFVVSNHWTGFGDRTISRLQVWLARRAFPRAARILAVDRNSPEYYRRYGIEARVSWMFNAYDEAIFFPPPPNLPRSPTLLHVSGFIGQKRPLDIIEAFARARDRIPEARLIMVGDGALRPAAEARARELLPEGSYAFPGFLPKPEVAARMREAKAFLLPSQFECQPCVLIEALACGLPAITTRVGSIPDLIDDEAGIFVPVGDIAALATAMRDVLEDRRVFDPRALHERARARYSFAAVGQMLHEEHAAAAGVRP